MGEIVSLGIEEYELNNSEKYGLSRIVLAVNAVDTSKYLTGIQKIHSSITQNIHAIKLPREAEVAHPPKIRNGVDFDISRLKIPESRTVLYSADQLATGISRSKKVSAFMVDTKFSNDGKELAASVRGLHTASSNFLDRLDAKQRDPNTRKIDSSFTTDRLRKVWPAKYISFLMHHMVDPKEIKTAVEEAKNWFEPIAMVSSSKQDKTTNYKYGLRHKDLTVSMTRMALDAGFTHLTASSNDGELIRDVVSNYSSEKEIKIYGTGAVLLNSDVGEHDATESVDIARKYIDYFVLGRSVLLHSEPDRHLMEYAREIGTN